MAGRHPRARPQRQCARPRGAHVEQHGLPLECAARAAGRLLNQNCNLKQNESVVVNQHLLELGAGKQWAICLATAHLRDLSALYALRPMAPPRLNSMLAATMRPATPTRAYTTRVYMGGSTAPTRSSSQLLVYEM